MKIHRLSEKDKSIVRSWRYKGRYEQFNYALEDGGWIDIYCKKSESPCFSCEEGGTLVGVFLFIPEKENEFRVLVNPDELSRGYGKKITGMAIETALRDLHYGSLSLIVRKNHSVAISLYEKIGFVLVGETVENIGGEEIGFYKMLLKI